MQAIKSIASKLTGKSEDYALPKGSLILVTGASGYIGSHVVNEALAAGYKVRGTARTQEKCDTTKKIFNNNPDYSTVIVADHGREGCFDEAVQGCDAIIHVASDTTFDADPERVIKTTVNGLNSMLKSAAKAPSVKRFVYTSSSTALLLPRHDEEFTVTEDDWNDDAIKLAWAPPPYTPDRGFNIYAASKTEAERALWKFVKEEKPAFVTNAVLPNLTAGRILPKGNGGVTGILVPMVLNGQAPPLPSQHIIDVIDNARIHLIAAVLDSSLENKRIFAFSEPYTLAGIIKILKELRPNSTTIPAPPENEPVDRSKVPNQLGAALLRKWYGQDGYKPMKQIIAENIEGM